MSAANNIRSNRQPALAEFEALFQQASDSGIDDNLLERITGVLTRCQDSFPKEYPELLQGIFRGINNDLRNVSGAMSAMSNVKALEGLTKIKNTLKRLSVLCSDAHLKKIATEAQPQPILLELEQLKKEKFLIENESVALKSDIIDKLIQQGKLQEAWELGKQISTLDESSHPVNRFIENNLLLEAIPFIITLDAQNCTFWLSQIIIAFSRRLSDAEPKTRGLKMAEWVQQMIDAGADPKTGAEWCRNSHLEVLQRFIYNGADPQIFKNKLNPLDKDKIPILDKAAATLKTVLGDMQNERLARLVADNSMSAAPVEVLRLISNYSTNDELRQEVVKRCLARAEI